MSTYPLQLAPRSIATSTAERLTPTDTTEIQASVPIVDGPRVLLATTCHLPSSARLAMELARAGAQVHLLSPADHPARQAKAGSHWRNYSALHPLHSLRGAIAAVAPDIVIPCDERVVRHLHGLHRLDIDLRISHIIERSLGSPRGFAATTARHDLLMLARREGVCVTDTMRLSSIEDLQEWARQQPFPWVLKADGSWAGFGVRVVRSLDEAEEAYRQMIRPTAVWLAIREALLERDLFWFAPCLARAQPAMSIQNYIDGWPANCAVACWEGEVLAGICAESVTTQSQTGPSTVARVIDNPDMLDAARRVVGALGCSGLVGFDFMVEAATGAFHMIEMNPRVTPMSTVRLGPGRDLVEALLARVTGRPVCHTPPVTERDIIVFFPHTWRLDPGNVYLQAGYHDVPWEEPALVRVLMRPELRDRYWFTRGLRRLWLAARKAQAKREAE